MNCESMGWEKGWNKHYQINMKHYIFFLKQKCHLDFDFVSHEMKRIWHSSFLRPYLNLATC